MSQYIECVITILIVYEVDNNFLLCTILVGLTCINNYIKKYCSTVLLFHSLLRDALYAFKCLITFIKYVKLYCIYFAVDGHDILNWNDLIRLKNYLFYVGSMGFLLLNITHYLLLSLLCRVFRKQGNKNDKNIFSKRFFILWTRKSIFAEWEN